jgi:hypothetical protein
VLTTKITLPLYWHKDWGFSSCNLGKVWFSKAGHAAGALSLPAGVCAQAEDRVKAPSSRAHDFKSLRVGIKLSVLFCDWTVYFYFFNLSRTD